MILSGALIISTSLFFNACSDKNIDSEAPVITLNEPKNEDAIKIGDPAGVHSEMELSDNIKLSSYKVNIHSNFDHHSHTRADESAVETAAFEYTKVFMEAEGEKLSTKKNAHIHHHEIIIPATFNGKPIKEGEYHFIVYCTDLAGNESFVVRDVILSYSAASHTHE